MKNLFEKNFTRRNFLTASAKILAGAALFGFLPDKVEAARKKRMQFFLPEFKKLDELEINSYPLDFGSLEKRAYTGAVVIHHSGMRNVDMTVGEIHDLHKYKNRWSGIGYHFVIHKDGIIEHGRPIETKGAHSLLNNEFTVGICLTGNYNIGEPPQTQVSSAVQLIGAICDKYNFEPTDTTIFGHRDLGKTTCPGDSLYKLLPNIISGVQYIL